MFKTKHIIGLLFMLSIAFIIKVEAKPFAFGHKNHNSHTASSNKGHLTAFYGDITDQRIVGIDVASMTLTSDTPTEGLKPYTVGRADGINGHLNKLYGMTRNSLWVEIIDINTRELEGKIDLLHTPRSCAYNEKLGLQLISGVDKPMSSLIDPTTDTVVATVGRNTLVNPTDFGGSNATGHPVWLSKNIFAVLDREVRQINLYKVKKRRNQWRVRFLSSLRTHTFLHNSNIQPHHTLNLIFENKK